MRTALAILSVVPLLGQGRPAIKVHLEGVVVDDSGKPIERARVDHGTRSPFPYGPYTDAQGHFSIEAEGPAVVIRKPGFESYFLRLDGTNSVEVVMRAELPWPRCNVAPTRRVKTVQGRDVDYIQTSRVVETKEGPKALRAGEGPYWSAGMPPNDTVWGSVEYVEHVEPSRGRTEIDIYVVDARGKTKEGHYWRYRGNLIQSNDYSDVDQPTAALMDRLIGGNCPPF